MSSCLGLYIESNLIKYAKISKERDVLKIDAFGVKFYDKIGEAIRKIIDETYSYKTPLSINLSEETYNYFQMFSLLNKNDLKKAIATEFESLCLEKGTNQNALEKRYALVNSLDDKEKIRVIHVSANKNSINTSEQQLEENKEKISTIAPISLSIANIANLKQKENSIIINMEEKTTVTTIVDQKVYDIQILPEGSKDVLDSINSKENSYSKAFDICKNSTIYTMEGQELQDEENEYLDDIMPTLYKIASKIQEQIGLSTIKIDRIYITGTLSVINNIDLYFQEFFKTEKCELLKPFFIADSVKINIKDYIEVNSATALALQGLGYGLKDINFRKQNFTASLSNLVTFDNGNKEKGKTKITEKRIDFSNIFKFDFKKSLDKTEKWMLRLAAAVFLFTVAYMGFSFYLNHEITNKKMEVDTVKTDTESKIVAVSSDISNINSKINRYTELTNNLKKTNDQIAENNKNRKMIPNLLSSIMFSMPRGVQITAIENTTTKHIVISAQSSKYEQLGYFKAILGNAGILAKDTIVSSAGTKEGDVVKIVIEGDLP